MPRIIFLVGPTAIGKTEIAVLLAKKLKAEIVSADSMQIYKGMDIITSKPPVALRKKVPHHLISVILPFCEYNVSQYRYAAARQIKGIIKRKKIPLLVGGTGLYMSILVDGIFEIKTEKPRLRNRLYHEAERYGGSFLHSKLKKVDPSAADKIHPNDTRRLVRALEVFNATGKPISELQKQRKGLSDEYEVEILALNMARDELYKRIDARVEQMFAQGLVQEVRKLLKTRLSKTASYAIGIRELKGFFDGLYDLEEAKRLMKRNTRQYAKRQLTWFRKDKRIKWINLGPKERPQQIANLIFNKINGKSTVSNH